MTTIKDILDKYNLNLNLHQKLLELNFHGEFELQDMGYVPSNSLGDGDDGPYRYVKEFYFRNEYDDTISIRPDLERTTIISVTDDLYYYNKFGNMYTISV